jgi:ectoine hydroxylase
MTPEQILTLKPKVLSQTQRESYFANGFLLLEGIVSTHVIETLRHATAEKIGDPNARQVQCRMGP